MELRDQHIIKLDHVRAGQSVNGSMRRVENADVVIDEDGKVIKNRFGTAERVATPEELRLAVPG